MVPDFAAGEDNFSNNIDPIGWLTFAKLGDLGSILLVGGATLFLWLLWRRS